jgi:ATP-dependent helicase/nuclease subunit A
VSKSHALPTTLPQAPPDQPARDAALDVTDSWIVQAPAGAGKTELLTQRFLKLLSVVDAPEEILAITFTRAATAEMRGRIVAALEDAARTSPTSHDPRTLQLARAALAHAKAQGWQLLEQPHRLDIQTIDSLCLRLAHGQPLLSRLGGQLEPTEQAAALYDLAAQRTFALLGRAPTELEAALAHLLLLRDNNLADCHQLIAGMLAQREQWRHVFVLGADATIDWNEVRTRLEAPFADEVHRVLGQLHTTLTAEPTLVQEMLELARYACSNGNPAPISLLDGLQQLPSPEAHFSEHWTCLRNFLLTQNGSWRRSVTVRDGFPPDGAGLSKAERTRYKQRMTGLIADLQRNHPAGERLRALLCRVSTLPAARYDQTQWQTLLSVFRVLRRAVAELHVVFAERNQVDFAELSIAAATVLDDRENTRGLLASEATRHLLIDEFQDTSRRQHQLIGRLLHEWQPGDGRTCFLVGDPMQSIYIFRQAEVELFGRVQRHGLDCGSHAHPCSGLRLSENFRSHRGLVDPLNRHFAAIFGEPPGDSLDTPRNEVPFAPSTAAAPALDGLNAVQVHAFFCSSRQLDSTATAREAQITRVVELVKQELPHIAVALASGAPAPGAKKTYTVAILGRAKNHLAPIAAALRARGIPFRAVELETLADRQEILDLQSLLRALLHPLDRIAWLSVLRAPWCGLTLGDLHTLTGADHPDFRATPVPDLITERASLLTADGGERLARVSAILTRAAAEAFGRIHAQSLAAWVERTWTSLGAPAYLTAEERENTETFFRLLDGLPPDGIDALNGNLDAALEHLCAAPDATVSEQFGVQLMTIHKAKGLGFEVVIVPALERQPGGDSSPLVTLLERVRPDAAEENEARDEVLVAPLGSRGEQHRTYKWIQSTRSARQAGERKRLFYVACTRARRQLHLLGTAELSSSGELRPGAPESLLACAWPALGSIFEAARQAPSRESSVPLPTPLPSVPQPGLLDRLAASGALAPHAVSTPSLHLWRVPSGFVPELPAANVAATGTYPRIGAHANQEKFTRPEGSFEQRARGNAVHAMLELVSEAWARAGAPGSTAALAQQLERLARTILGRAGLAPTRVDALSPGLVAIVLAAAAHPQGQWILSPHPGAQSEWSLSGWTGTGDANARLRTLRVDRIFRAGDTPLSQGSRCLWIIDYKTGGDPGSIALDAYLEAQKQQWRPQLESYGNALSGVHGENHDLRYGLYFPELLQLKSWRG